MALRGDMVRLKFKVDFECDTCVLVLMCMYEGCTYKKAREIDDLPGVREANVRDLVKKLVIHSNIEHPVQH